MKKLLAFFICCAAFASVACAGDSRPITMNELPATARAFILQHFAEMTVAYVDEDPDIFDKSYNLGFSNGDKIEFENDGTWSEVSCPHSAVPVAVIPLPIVEYMAKNHPAMLVKKIEQGKRGYELKLGNGLELKFDKKFRMVKIDD
ncbi:MAG: PepSY-like domain-containing protein [Alistipes sp.]